MPLEISCNNPPTGFVGVPYTHTFPATGGTEPYTFSITFGSLPDGLTLGAGTGIVSGTPTTKGESDFTVQVVDAIDADAQAECSILIRPKCLLGDVE